MKFSVLMSVYKNDNPDYFYTALESVTTNQSLKPNQVVIVCDGPVSQDIDNSIEKIKKDNLGIEFTIKKLEKNQGLASALNNGLKECKYDWVARMDADDISISNRFEKQIDYIEKHNDISVLGGLISEFDQDPNLSLSIRKVGLSYDEVMKMIKIRNPMNHMSVIFNRNDVLSVGGYTVNFGKLEDYKLWVDLVIAEKKLENLGDVLVNVRVGNGFIDRRSEKREIIDWDNLQKYLLKGKIINKFEAFMNRIYIRIFIYTPPFIKKFIYKKILRRN